MPKACSLAPPGLARLAVRGSQRTVAGSTDTASRGSLMSRWDWLGLKERRWEKPPDVEIRPAKTAWDWLQLAVVPVVLAAVALAFNASQASRERSREDRRTTEDRALALDARRDETLRNYITQMSGLM